jgi:OmcA/MtrC family decaheme c-type cytochrome
MKKLFCITTLLSCAASAATFQFNILSIKNLSGASTVSPGQFVVVTYSVTNPQTGMTYDLRQDPAWTQTASGASKLVLQIGWNASDFTNTDSGTPNGVALPIPVDALSNSVIPNGDGTYTVTAPAPIPGSATGTGEVAMTGHPAAKDASGAYIVKIPVVSVHAYFPITGTTTARRKITDLAKCQKCHKTDGTGAAPALVAHDSMVMEDAQTCVVCHNPNATDAAYRLPSDPKVVVGSYTFPEQSVDAKRFGHSIHATVAGFRKTPFVSIAAGHKVFDASKLRRFPAELSKCALCHVDDGHTGTFELPIASGDLGTTVDSKTFRADGTKMFDNDAANDVNITPIAATCSGCHDDREAIQHMVRTGGASFNATQGQIASGSFKEACGNATCHGPSASKSVRRAHE